MVGLPGRHPGRAMELKGGGNKKREIRQRGDRDKNDRDGTSERGGGATEGISSRARKALFLIRALTLLFPPSSTHYRHFASNRIHPGLCAFHIARHMSINTHIHKQGQSC